ncbi:MAG TPA: aminopeptidase [bacterium]|nr:aminopeptidase [bacterium]
MKDPRLVKLADTLVNYSTKVKPGDKVLIEAKGDHSHELVKEIVTKVAEAGGLPFYYYNEEEVERRWVLGASEAQLKAYGQMHLRMMRDMACYIAVRGSNNSFTMADIPRAKREMYQKYYYKPVHLEQRVERTRWVVLRYPNYAMAQLAETSREAFEDYYFSVCNVDYAKMDKAQDALAALMRKTDKVHIKGPGTDLTFSIKGIPPRKCAGNRNIPDGEVYTAPVRTSINGEITYNCPSIYESTLFDRVHFVFKNGKIVHADCATDNAKLNKILDTDPGARYIGEFSFGLNPNITRPMKDILFDEKIFGSIHLTPGQCYKEAPNGNKSAIHWDLVLIQTKEFGGGEIYMDGTLVRKDGIWVHPALKDKLSAKALR